MQSGGSNDQGGQTATGYALRRLVDDPDLRRIQAARGGVPCNGGCDRPDLGFRVDRVNHGTLVAITVSEYEPGLAGSRLARARKLGIKVHSGLPLSAQIIMGFAWTR